MARKIDLGMMLILWGMLALLVAAGAPAQAEGAPAVVREINTQPSPASGFSYPASFIALGNKVFFRAHDSANGTELWVTDGTPAGTGLFMDITPGPGNSDPIGFTVLNGILYFVANGQLWRTDGTRAATWPVSSQVIVRGDPASSPLLVASGGALYFKGYDNAHGIELWRSDGTAAGTQLVKDINPGTEDSGLDLLVDANGTLFFRAWDQVHGWELWKSDGTDAGTMIVRDILPGFESGGAEDLTAVGSTVFFLATTPATGYELWKSDGTTSGTVLVKDIYPGRDFVTTLGMPSQLTSVNGTLFFVASDGVHGNELWKSDGMTSGTVMVKDISPGSSTISQITAVGDKLYFIANYDLWVSDGTTSGTAKVQNPKMNEMMTLKKSMAALNGKLYLFAGYSDAPYCALWAVYGTSMTAVRTVSGSMETEPWKTGLASVGGSLYFLYQTTTDSSVAELWKSDGTSAGTVRLGNLQYKAGGSFPANLTPMNGQLYFSAYEPGTMAELWKSDGTAAGTAMVKDCSWSYYPQRPHTMNVADGQLWFLIVNDLWRSDGTAAGTLKVNAGVSPDYYLMLDGSPCLFQTQSNKYTLPLQEQSIWRYDTAASTSTLIARLESPVVNYDYYTQARPVVAGHTVFFFAGDTSHGVELWLSNGTPSGTMMVKDIAPGVKSSSPSGLVTLGNRVYFTADDSSHGQELWVSDGTAAGTFMVRDIYPGAGGSAPDNMQVVGGQLYFCATDGISGRELWRTDGTAAGTFLVRDIYPGPGESVPSNLTDFGGRVYFAADDGVHGRELWSSDGTEAGTVLVKDIEPGPLGSRPAALAGVGQRLWFSAWSRDTGVELWSSDGTTDGTHQVSDLVLGPGSSNPGNFTQVGTRLCFSAESGGPEQGQELWRIDGAVTPVRAWRLFE